MGEEYIGEVEDVLGVTREQLKKDLFIDLWNAACTIDRLQITEKVCGRYNVQTGYFELNGITDITYEEALYIYARSQRIFTTNLAGKYTYDMQLRTILPMPPNTYTADLAVNLQGAFYNCPKLEVINLGDIKVNTMFDAFSRLGKLREILGVVDVSKVSLKNFAYAFSNDAELREFRFKGVAGNISLKQSPLISYETLRFLVDNAVNTSLITIEVHLDTFSKLTDSENSEWYQLNQDAAGRQISFLAA